MLYPKTYTARKKNKIINFLAILSVIICILCKVINVLTYPAFDWAFIAILGIIYVWITVMYSIRKNTNVAAHVLLQVVLLIGLVIFLDHTIGYIGWSLNLALPIIIIAANTIMFILTIIARRKYIRYAVCHLIIFIISFLPICLYLLGKETNVIFVIISSLIALVTFIVTSIMCGRELLEAAEKTLHI